MPTVRENRDNAKRKLRVLHTRATATKPQPKKEKSKMAFFVNLVDKLIPVGVGSRTKIVAVVGGVANVVAGVFPDVVPFVDTVANAALSVAAVFGAVGLLRK